MTDDPEAAWEEMQARIRRIVADVEQLPDLERAAFEMMVEQRVLEVEAGVAGPTTEEEMRADYQRIIAWLKSLDADTNP